MASDFLLSVKLTPKSASDRIEGFVALADGSRALKVRVRAPPEDGKANRDLLRLLAQALDLPISSLRLQSGAAARLKRIAISVPAETLSERLMRLG